MYSANFNLAEVVTEATTKCKYAVKLNQLDFTCHNKA